MVEYVYLSMCVQVCVLKYLYSSICIRVYVERERATHVYPSCFAALWLDLRQLASQQPPSQRPMQQTYLHQTATLFLFRPIFRIINRIFCSLISKRLLVSLLHCRNTRSIMGFPSLGNITELSTLCAPMLSIQLNPLKTSWETS